MIRARWCQIVLAHEALVQLRHHSLSRFGRDPNIIRGFAVRQYLHIAGVWNKPERPRGDVACPTLILQSPLGLTDLAYTEINHTAWKRNCELTVVYSTVNFQA